ncbi:reverse transcriptase [Gossypium australe]|uniref:Reverse transcriptase n=1 Tax=Gossypium australe TaxID=47621 RepID=A0A5B6WUF4_9ROSI|nr:reverse transcriptase [Gossypium australe]
MVCQALNVQCSSDPKKYLGLPSMVGRKRKLAFQRINGWSIRHISQGGREVFIKAVLQAIPTYSMTCFLLPKLLCLEMENIMNSFWWNKTNGKRGMHWCDWKSLSASKEEGGLGFRDLSFFNTALLAKQGEILLGVRFLKIQLVDGKGLLLKGLGWRVGDGQKISIWEDRWVPGNEMLNCQNSSQNSSLVKVVELIDNNTRRWNEELILRTFAVRDAKRILCIPLSMRSHEDFFIWREEATEEYSVRSGHRVLAQGGHTQIQDSLKKFYKKLWSLDLPSKIKITAWLSMCNYLPNFSNLHYRRIMGPVNCKRCQAEIETREHLFRNCHVAKETWERLEMGWYVSEETEFTEWVKGVFENNSLLVCRRFVCAL